MRFHGFLTVSSVFCLVTITTSARPRAKFTTTALATTPPQTLLTTSYLPSHYHHGRQASPDTASSKTTTPTAEYASSESSKKDCGCAEEHSLIDSSPTLSSRALTTTTAPSLTTSSMATPAYLYSSLASSVPPSTSQSSSQVPQIQPTLQSQYYGMPATTVIQLGQSPVGSPDTVPSAPVPIGFAPAPPGGAAIPSTITPTTSAPTSTQDIEALISRGGQPWYQVTYFQCVTWPSEYVHCGWHTPLRIGRNPDPRGETFVYGAAVRVNGRIRWVVAAVAGVVMLTL